ncbi:MAG: hypothetical protein AABW92_05455 [Nanoarchaeota archaeon]
MAIDFRKGTYSDSSFFTARGIEGQLEKLTKKGQIASHAWIDNTTLVVMPNLNYKPYSENGFSYHDMAMFHDKYMGYLPKEVGGKLSREDWQQNYAKRTN